MIRLNRNALVVASVTLTLITVVACESPSTEMNTTVEPAAPANPLVGVWQMTSATAPDGTSLQVQPTVMTLTNSHFSYVGITPPAMPAKPATPFQPTADEALAILSATRAGAGTYTFDGSTMTWRFVTAGVPNMVGGTVTLGVEVTGDTMTSRVIEISDVDGASQPQMPIGTATYRRLE